MVEEKHAFIFKEYSVVIEILFQEIHKGPKHLQLWKIYWRFSRDCYMLR